MSNALTSCVTIPGKSKINSCFQDVQNDTLKWVQQFDIAPKFKPLSWYSKARFGFQAAREYPDATYAQVSLAGDLLSWLFTVDDSCDRGSADAATALEMRRQLEIFIAILNDEYIEDDNGLSMALKDILHRFSAISSPFLYRRYCMHMTDYLNECFFEIDMQIDGLMPSIDRYYKERPYTGFYIMFPLVAIFEKLNLSDEVYDHSIIREIELILNLLGCLSNDLHSIVREAKLEKPGFNLIFIAQKELDLGRDEAVQYVINEHKAHLLRFEQLRAQLPYWGRAVNEQVDRYIQGLYTIVRGYDDWAVIDTGRYENI
ncbi:hypothetical protein QFZ48_006172 [Chitinophaga sp. W2I13]|uniref:terpene synthase family protein n=1 Tax=Chitinophaga sp. W2I13 TaxID=3373923 RepID=UPI003D1C8305